MSPAKSCPFCQLGPDSARIIRTGRLWRSFLSDPRLVPGHTLVIPSRHVESPTQLEAAEIQAIFGEIRRLQAKLLDSGALGVDQWQKTRPAVAENGRKVDHVHFHVLASNPGDELYDQSLTWTSDRFGRLTESECKQMVDRLR